MGLTGSALLLVSSGITDILGAVGSSILRLMATRAPFPTYPEG